MEPEVYLFGARQAGYLTPSSQYASDVKMAKRFSLSEARIIANRHKQGGNSLLILRIEDQV